VFVRESPISAMVGEHARPDEAAADGVGVGPAVGSGLGRGSPRRTPRRR
jgi:hypothetical protein